MDETGTEVDVDVFPDVVAMKDICFVIRDDLAFRISLTNWHKGQNPAQEAGTAETSVVSSDELSTALGALFSPLFHLPSSPAQAPAPQAHSHSSAPPRSSKQSRHSRQAKDVADLMSQMARVLENLVMQQTIEPASAQAPPLAPVPAQPQALALEPIPFSLAVTPVVSEQDEAMSTEEHDTIFIEASWEPEVQEITKKTGPSSEVASETDVAPPTSSANTRGCQQGRGNAGRGAPAHQCSGRHFQRNHPR
ncbi:hypothetical protein EOD39_7362 [Acipenser ruthenus]|uniref:Uncharacterized protein n=1 Tax=Acipenser ruthenus TaxID=7906 RepID=A0A444U7A2_ACIRT|nr:hypothetical protein EOD39_7362 [Acipenser ruthenus]